MIVERVVCGIVRRQRSNPPTTEQIRLKKTPHQPRKMLVTDDTGCEALSCVRGQRSYLLFFAVEAEGNEPFVLHPEIPIEPLLEVGGVTPQPNRDSRFAEH